MQILINSNHSIDGTLELSRWIEGVVEDSLGRFGEQVTRVEVHVNDVNSHKQGTNDKRCSMEARLSGLKPIAVSHQAATLNEAVNGAAEKLEQAIDRRIGRISETRGPAPREDEIVSVEELQRLEREEKQQPRG